MSQEVKQIRIQQKVDTKENWEINNPILLDKEIGYEKETGRYKIGDGVSNWNDLSYNNGAGHMVTDNNTNIVFNDYTTNIIGQKGYLIKDIVNYTTNSNDVVISGDYILSNTTGLEIGDTISFKINYNRYNFTTITDIDHSTFKVSVETFYNGEKYQDTGKGMSDTNCTYTYLKTLFDKNDCYFYCVNKPEVGDSEEFNEYDIAFGVNNRISKAYASMVSGSNNTLAGNYSQVLGHNNEVGHHTYIFGNENNAMSGEGNWIIGRSNNIKGWYNNVNGSLNNIESNAEYNNVNGIGNKIKANSKYNNISGYYNIVEGNNQTVRGKYNQSVSNDFAEIVGGGNSSTNRKNIYTLDWNGNATYTGDIISNGTNINSSITSLETKNNKLKNDIELIKAEIDNNETLEIFYLSSSDTDETICINKPGVYYIYLGKIQPTIHINKLLAENYNKENKLYLYIYGQSAMNSISVSGLNTSISFSDNLPPREVLVKIFAKFDIYLNQWILIDDEIIELNLNDLPGTIEFNNSYSGALTSTNINSKPINNEYWENYFVNNLDLSVMDRNVHTVAHISPILRNSRMLTLSVDDVRNTNTDLVEYFNNGEYFKFIPKGKGKIYVLTYTSSAKGIDFYKNSSEWKTVNDTIPSHSYSSLKEVPYNTILTDAPYVSYFQWKSTDVIGNADQINNVKIANSYHIAFEREFDSNDTEIIIPPLNYNQPGGLPMLVFIENYIPTTFSDKPNKHFQGLSPITNLGIGMNTMGLTTGGLAIGEYGSSKHGYGSQFLIGNDYEFSNGTSWQTGAILSNYDYKIATDSGEIAIKNYLTNCNYVGSCYPDWGFSEDNENCIWFYYYGQYGPNDEVISFYPHNFNLDTHDIIISIADKYNTIEYISDIIQCGLIPLSDGKVYVQNVDIFKSLMEKITGKDYIEDSFYRGDFFKLDIYYKGTGGWQG